MPDHSDPASLLGKIYKANILYHIFIVVGVKPRSHITVSLKKQLCGFRGISKKT